MINDDDCFVVDGLAKQNKKLKRKRILEENIMKKYEGIFISF